MGKTRARLPVTFGSLRTYLLYLIAKGASEVGVRMEDGLLTELCWSFPGGPLQSLPVYLVEGKSR